MTADGLTSREQFVASWHRQQALWHLLYAAVWVAALAVTLLDEPGSRGVVPEIACLLGMALAYVALGVRALTKIRLGNALAYHVLSWGLLFVIGLLNPETEAWVLFFALFPHLWAMLPGRLAAGATVVVVAVWALVRWSQTDFASHNLAPTLVSALISMTLSLAMGLFINHLVGQAEERATTIDELRATQARLATLERDRGVREERERLSREIHDTLAQGFTSVLALSRAAGAALGRSDIETARERLALIEQTAADNLTEARLIVAELTPGHLQSRTLVEALGRLVAAVSTEAGLRASLESMGEPEPLGAAKEIVIFRTAQEALSNVRRHASARHCAVVMSYVDPDQVVLTVTDDGVGFEPQARPAGFGLDGVRSRVGEVNGVVEVMAAPGSGTQIRLQVPR